MSITLKQSGSWRKLWRVAIRPEILPHIFDDSRKPMERPVNASSWALALDESANRRFRTNGDFLRWAKTKVRSLIANPRNMVFAVRYHSQFAGMFLLYFVVEGVYEVHTLLLKDFHGRKALEIGRFAARFGLALPGVNRLTSFCPDNAPQTYVFARMCGFKYAGTYPMRWFKNGVSYAIKAVELTKSDLAPGGAATIERSCI